MSDYISKSDVIKIIEKAIENTSDFLQHDTQIDIMFEVQELPTVDEKEIIRKTVERIVERLEEKLDKTDLQTHLYKLFIEGEQYAFDTAIEIVKEEGGIE